MLLWSTMGALASPLPDTCASCHEPEKLLSVGRRLRTRWIRDWLVAPFPIRSGAEPHEPLAVDRADDIARWMTRDSARKATLPSWFRSPRPEEGKRLYVSYGCGTCHDFGSLRGRPGRMDAPNLQWVSQRMTAPMVVAWIEDPQGISPKSSMPNLGVTPTEAAAIRDFLWAGVETSGGSRIE